MPPRRSARLDTLPCNAGVDQEQRSGRLPADRRQGCTHRRERIFLIGGVAVDHRIHVAGRDAEEQVRSPSFKVVFGLPVGCAMMPDAKALRLQQRPMIAMPNEGWST